MAGLAIMGVAGAAKGISQSIGDNKTDREKIGDENVLANQGLQDANSLGQSKLGFKTDVLGAATQAGGALDKYKTTQLSDQNNLTTQQMQNRQGDLKATNQTMNTALTDYANHPGAVTQYNYTLPQQGYKKGGKIKGYAQGDLIERSPQAPGAQALQSLGSNPSRNPNQTQANMYANAVRSQNGMEFNASDGSSGFLNNNQIAQGGSDPWSRIAADTAAREAGGNNSGSDAYSDRGGVNTAYGGHSENTNSVSPVFDPNFDPTLNDNNRSGGIPNDLAAGLGGALAGKFLTKGGNGADSVAADDVEEGSQAVKKLGLGDVARDADGNLINKETKEIIGPEQAKSMGLRPNIVGDEGLGPKLDRKIVSPVVNKFSDPIKRDQVSALNKSLPKPNYTEQEVKKPSALETARKSWDTPSSIERAVVPKARKTSEIEMTSPKYWSSASSNVASKAKEAESGEGEVFDSIGNDMLKSGGIVQQRFASGGCVEDHDEWNFSRKYNSMPFARKEAHEEKHNFPSKNMFGTSDPSKMKLPFSRKT